VWRRVKLFIAAIALVAYSSVASACAAHPSQPSRPLGQPFDLKAGTSAVLADGLKLTFERVRADSRCPLDALCIQAGEAIVVLTLSQSAAAQDEREVSTTPARSEAAYLSYAIKLVALAPYPRSTQQIRPDEYVATLTVDRHATAAFDDGRIYDLTAGTIFYIPPQPHDSWVVGNEPYVSLHLLGANQYAQ
jgi:hypothetical protein